MCAVFKIGLRCLYTNMVTAETLAPLIKLSGATAKQTNVVISVMDALTEVPIAINSSIGIWNNTAKTGNK